MTAAVESPAERSPWWLAFRVFDEPGQVFTELAERPRALVPVVLLLVATFGMAMGIPTPVIQNGIRQQFDALEQRRPGAIPPEVRERALAQAGAMGGRVRNSLIGSAALVIFLAIGAAILSLIFNSISGTEIGFKDEWAIVTHACMPLVIGTVVTGVAISFTGELTFRLGLGFLISKETSPFGHTFLQLFSVFGIWTAYLLALGNQIKMKAKGIGAALTVIGGIWAVINAVLAWLSSLLGGMLG